MNQVADLCDFTASEFHPLHDRTSHSQNVADALPEVFKSYQWETYSIICRGCQLFFIYFNPGNIWWLIESRDHLWEIPLSSVKSTLEIGERIKQCHIPHYYLVLENISIFHYYYFWEVKCISDFITKWLSKSAFS